MRIICNTTVWILILNPAADKQCCFSWFTCSILFIHCDHLRTVIMIRTTTFTACSGLYVKILELCFLSLMCLFRGDLYLGYFVFLYIY